MFQKWIVKVLLSMALVSGPLMVLAKGCRIPSQAECFTTQFFQQIVKDKSGQNFVVSGDSLASVLSMLEYGATGVTQQELSKALCGASTLCQGEGLKDHPGYLAANAVWVQHGLAIKPGYRADIEKRFNGDIASVDFQKNKTQAVQKINAWAKKNTKGMIDQIVKASDFNPMTAMVLANALYFQGFWPTEFDTKKTEKREFTLLNGQKVNVPTMMKKDNYFLAKHNNIKMLGLPYRDSNLEMVVLMPENPKKYSEFLKSLTTETIAALVTEQKKSELMLLMPKFSIASSYDDLKKNLQALGIKKVFEPNAELNNINDKVPLFLSKVLQKAIIQVDEKGTKAAAVTAGIVLTRAVLEENFQIDRPFVFAIVDQQSHKIPFIGQVVNPLKN